MCRLSHALFHQPDNTSGIQVAKLLVVQFPPASCCFLSLSSKHYPQTLDNPVFLLTFLQEATRWPLQFCLKIKHSFSRVQPLSRVHGYKKLRSISENWLAQQPVALQLPIKCTHRKLLFWLQLFSCGTLAVTAAGRGGWKYNYTAGTQFQLLSSLYVSNTWYTVKVDGFSAGQQVFRLYWV